MTPDTLRLLDRWIGGPLCRMASLWDRVAGLGRPAPDQPPRRILFIGLAEIGALVIAHGAVERARTMFPGAELYFLTSPAGLEMTRLLGFDDDHIVLVRSGAGPWALARDTLAALGRLRRIGIDTAVNFEVFVRFSTLLARLSGARRRAGFHPFGGAGPWFGRLITHPVLYNPHLHAAVAYQTLVAALAGPASTPAAAVPDPLAKVPQNDLPVRRLAVAPDPARRQAMWTKLVAQCPALSEHHRLVILNANASDLVPQRRWSLDSYIALARRLLEDPQVVIVLTGAPGERNHITALAGRIGAERVINMAGRTSFAELLDLYHLAHLLVTNDSGPAHFASVTELPTLVLFGPETPRLFGPLGPNQEAITLRLACSPCVSVYNQKRSPCRDNICLTGITVDMVYRRARARLDGAPAGPSGRDEPPPEAEPETAAGSAMADAEAPESGTPAGTDARRTSASLAA